MPATRGPFRYLRDPLFGVAVLLYVANNLLAKPVFADRAAFVHCYFGDVLCLPVCVPVTLWLQRRLGLRDHDRPPGARELLLLWGWWSCCFEWIGPGLPLLAPGAVSDPWDALAYLGGGVLGAACWWRGRGARPAELRRTPSRRHLLGRAAVATLVAGLVLGSYYSRWSSSGAPAHVTAAADIVATCSSSPGPCSPRPPRSPLPRCRTRRFARSRHRRCTTC